MQKTLSSIQYCFIPPRAISVVLLGLAIFLCFTSWASAATLRWDANLESDLAGYILYYKTGVSGAPYDGSGLTQGDSGVQLPVENLLNPLEPEFTLSGFEPGQTYYFTVTAYDRAGNESGYSNEERYDSPATGSFYSINATSSPNGGIAPSGVSAVSPGTAMEFQISPDPGFYVEDVTVDGVSVGPVSSYSFSHIDADHSIHALFAATPTVTITSTSAPNGTISPSGVLEVVTGSSEIYTIAADTGYHIADVLVDGSSVGALGTYTFENLAAPHTIHAVFGIDTSSVTSSFEGNGSISPSGTVVLFRGSNQTYTISADAGHYITDVLVDGISVGAVSTYTFENLTGAHTIRAVFGIDTPGGTPGDDDGATMVSLQWNANSESDLAGYILYYRTGASGAPYDGTGLAQGESGIQIRVDDLSDPSQPEYPLSGFEPGEAYYLTITAYDQAGNESGYSNEVRYGPPTEATRFSINATCTPNGSISPPGVSLTSPGTALEVQITPDPGFAIEDVTVDGVSVGPVSSYSFSHIDADHAIHASFASIPTMTITSTSAPNGTISPSGELEAVRGSNKTYTIRPNPGHHIVDILVDGVSVGVVGTYTFENITDPHSIHAVFGIDTFSVTSSFEGTGSISPSGTVALTRGSDQTYIMTADAGHHIADVLVDGAAVGAVSTYTFNNIAEPHAIHAVFAVDTFIVNAGAEGGGSISPSGAMELAHGGNQTYTIAADAGHHIVDVLVDGISVGAAGSYVLENITGPHTIHAVFAVNMFAVTAGSEGSGSISPSGSLQLESGSTQTYTIAADTGHHIADVLVDGISMGAVGTYTFESIAVSHTIHAVFGIDTFSVTSSAEAGGTISPFGLQEVNYGSNQTYTITADAGHHIADVMVDGVSVGAMDSYTVGNITEPRTIHALFAVDTVAVTAGSEGSGTITPPGSLQLESGSTQTYTIAADTGHHVADVLVDGVSVGAVGSYLFENLTGPHTIHAVFVVDTFTVTASSEGSGSISPSGTLEPEFGSNQIFTVTADTGHHITDVLVDGASVGAAGSYTFETITGSHRYTPCSASIRSPSPQVLKAEVRLTHQDYRN